MPKKLKYSLVMFVAGCCYGIVVPIVRSAYAAGYSAPQMMVTQYLVAATALIVLVCCFSRRRVPWRDALKLMGVGVVAAGVSFCYFKALELLPSATALTLLFQFVWMGMVVQCLRERKLPRPAALGSVVLVMIGAVLATGMVDEATSLERLDPAGLAFGLASAVFYTAFLVLSGRVATELPAVNRTMFQSFGSFAAAFVLCPTYFAQPVLFEIPTLSIALGLAGICLPVFLISLASPRLPHGLTTIMASSELPSGVICAALFLGEGLTLAVGIGVIIVLVGIVLSEFESLSKQLKKT